ncbi:hypothetical protein B8V81_4162 [Paenibacillus pasadenensis]|uniref:Uncharacterized protein n=2 Tax=Paenibacillus TaxID=44249 RepID=A0A2N5N5V2_9BACL|nr:hypothetical protein B8V81_4162 [Paenibacillus pasadenensis]QGG58721.1 hypothetical protein GE073_11665 [Paenibacillus sp. B01]
MRLAAAALVLLLLASLLPQAAAAAAPAPSKPDRPVQVFDVRAGKVVQSFPNEDAYQQIARAWLDAAEGLSPNLSPDDDCGYVFRIPLRKPASVKVGSLRLTAEDVFLFYCPEREPELLVFDERKKPYLLTARPDLRPFFERIGFEP